MPDLLSVDIDGNDFHLLASILLHGYRPRVVIVETCFNVNSDWDAVISYAADHRWDGTCYGSASVAAYYRMARHFNYSLVLGMLPDLYWVRDDVLATTVGANCYESTNDVKRILEIANPMGKFSDCQWTWRGRGFLSSAQAMESVAFALHEYRAIKSSLRTNIHVSAQ